MTDSRRCLIVVALLLASCNAKDSPPENQERRGDAAASARASIGSAGPLAAADADSRRPLLRPYPPGKWRFARDLTPVVVWGSHILIRHADSRTQVPFNLTYWSSVPESVTRSRAEALALARDIAAKLAKNPEEFASLARAHSEDLPTRDDGGFLGGFSAFELSSWPQVLDAFAALEVGGVSQVVETRYGFHVFQRAAAPVEQELEGAHIVIGHRQAQWLEVLGQDDLPSRSRDEALAIANKVYEQAKRNPTQFAELAARYSEHRDKVVGGDFGRWSTAERNMYPGRMKRLMKLRVGQVAPPVETHVGFEIIRRTQPRARAQYRTRSIMLQFEPNAPRGSANSKDAVLAKGEALAMELSRDPSKFEALSNDALVDDQWEEGRGVPALTLQVQKLELGAVAPEPVRAEFRFLIGQRIAPQELVPVSHRAELPTPAEPDLDGYFSDQRVEVLQETLQVALERFGPKVSETQLAELAELHQRVSTQNEDDLPAMYQSLHNRAQALLGPPLYAEYVAALRSAVASTLLSDAYRGLPPGGI